MAVGSLVSLSINVPYTVMPTVGREFVDGLAHRALAHLETRGEFDFAGDEFAGLPLAPFEAVHQQVPDLLVQRRKHRGPSGPRGIARAVFDHGSAFGAASWG